MRLSDQAILTLAAAVAPFVRYQEEIIGRPSPQITQEALQRIGKTVSIASVHRIDDAIHNYFV